MFNLFGENVFFFFQICRHGDRNIYKAYPTDPWASMDFWPGGYSALTNVFMFIMRS